MKIEKIIWLSNDSNEAEVLVGDGKFSLICFSHPFKLTLNSFLELPLYSMGTNYVKLFNENIFFIEKSTDTYSYHLIGQVTDVKNKIVNIGNIKIEIDSYIPSDIKNKDFIEFYCERIDVLG